MSRRRRLGCRIRGGHDDSVEVVGIVAGVGVGVLSCDACGRRRPVPYRGAAPPTLAEHAERNDVALVDKAALEQLTVSAEVGAVIVAGLLDRRWS